MLAPYRWIKDYTNFSENAEELASKMVMTGNGVENIEEIGANVSGVVVGKIEKMEKHPDADRLQVCQVDVGKEELLQIVTAAPNVFEGATLPVSLAGAKLADGTEIKKGKLRGVMSYGMFCSGEELGITEEEFPGCIGEGVYILSPDAKPGQDIKEYLGISGSVIEFEIGANRPDCLSILGIAKEAAAATGAAYSDPDISFNATGKNINDIVSVEVRDTDLCTRYMAGAVCDIEIKDSPDWMKKRLREAGIRPINNIVDITNFVMIETGQPMHAFDADDIADSKIIVRRAAQGEKITTLDDKEHDLTDSMLMICDGEKPIGIAGIMGGQNSEIKETTKNIVFESACFMYGNIRQTSRALGIATESSMRFSKSVSPILCEFALRRALHLIEQLGCGTVFEGLIDINHADLTPKTVRVSPEYINKRLGTQIPPEEMIDYLNKVFIETGFRGSLLECKIPGLRTDITGRADISEEVARMFGYDNIPSTLISAGLAGQIPPTEKFRDTVRNYLTCAGFFESITYSFAGEQDYRKLNMEVPDSIVIRNPFGDDSALMRTTLVSDMLKVISNNLSKKNNDLRLYEFGKHYYPNNNPEINAPVDEHHILIMACVGATEDFFTLKGEAENVVSLVTGQNFNCVRAEIPYFHPGKSAEMIMGDTVVGRIGGIYEDVLDNYDIAKPVYIAEIYIDRLLENISDKAIKYKALPKFPASERDIAVVVEDETGAGDALSVIVRAGGKKLESAKLFDVYKGPGLGEGKKSLAYKLVFRAEDRTLTDEETDAAFSKILRTLENECGAQLR